MSIRLGTARTWFTAALVASAILLGGPPARAAVFNWDGGDLVDDDWSTGANWVGDVAPGNPAANDDLFFAGATRVTPNVDAAWSGVQSIDFTTAAAAFTLGGNVVTYSATGAVNNTTAFDHAINNNLVGGATALNVTQNAGGNQLTFGGDIDLSAGGGLNITPTAGTTVFNGIISGGAAVTTNVGAGIVQLGAANTFTGGLNLNGGTVVAGADNNLGVGGGAMAFNTGTFQYSAGFTDSTRGVTLNAGGGAIDTNGNNATLQGVIGGAGALTKQGLGTLTLLGNNTYAGGTTVTGGTLVLGHAEAAGTGAVTMNGGNLEADTAGNPDIDNAVTVTQDFDLTITQNTRMSTVFTGIAARTITKEGLAQLTLTGASLATYLGAIVNNAGTLRFDGSTGGDVTNNANMQGVGLIGGNLINAAGGNLNPGNTPGIINVAGNFTNMTGATLTIELAPGGAAFPLTPGVHFDQVNVGGAATLQAGSITHVVTLNKGYIADGDLFDVIQTFGGVVDAGGLVTDAANFMTFTGAVAGNAYRLQANRVSYITAADTHNRTEVARGLDSLAAATLQTANNDAEILLAELDWLGPGAAFTSALDYLSPERFDIIDRVHQRTTQAFTDAHRNYLAGRRAGTWGQGVAAGLMAAAPMNAAPGAGVGPNVPGAVPGGAAGNPDRTVTVFVQPFGQVFEDDDQTDRTGYDAEMMGFLAGVDKQVSPSLVAGLLFGYADTNVNYGGLGGEAEIDTFRLGAYLSKAITPQWYLDGAVSYGFHSHEASRPIIVGVLNRTAEAEWNGHDVTIYAETGHDLAKQDDLALTPFGAMTYTWFHQDEYAEDGAGAASLEVTDQETHSLATLLGLRVSKTFGGRITFTPDLSVGWRHEFLADHNEDIGARFVDAPETFRIVRGGLETDTLNVSAGATVKLRENIDVNVFYNGDFSGDAESHSFGAGLNIRF